MGSTPVAHLARHKRIPFSLLGMVILFFVLAAGARAQDRGAASGSRLAGIVKLPVVDKKDIRFTQLTVGGESLQFPIKALRKTTTDSSGSGPPLDCIATMGTILRLTIRIQMTLIASATTRSESFAKIGTALFGLAPTLEGLIAWTRPRTLLSTTAITRRTSAV